MRRDLSIGGSLALAVVLLIMASDWLDLDLEAVALLGATAGALTAVVPSGPAATRLIGFLGGFGVAWIGFIVRAAVLPDTPSGRAVAAAVIVLLCTGISLATARRVRLWAVLLGAAAFAGAYEYTYNAAPPEVLSTSVTAATSLLLSAAVGWLAVSWVASDSPMDERPDRHGRGPSTTHDHTDTVPLNKMMESQR